jgi:hypothetical protein
MGDMYCWLHHKFCRLIITRESPYILAIARQTTLLGGWYSLKYVNIENHKRPKSLSHTGTPFISTSFMSALSQMYGPIYVYGT